MKPKELKEALDNRVLEIEIGEGDTVFHGGICKGGDKCYIDLNLLAEPVPPGNAVPIELCKGADTYLLLFFNNMESFKVFAEFVEKFHNIVKEGSPESGEVIL